MQSLAYGVGRTGTSGPLNLPCNPLVAHRSRHQHGPKPAAPFQLRVPVSESTTLHFSEIRPSKWNPNNRSVYHELAAPFRDLIKTGAWKNEQERIPSSSMPLAVLDNRFAFLLDWFSPSIFPGRPDRRGSSRFSPRTRQAVSRTSRTVPVPCTEARYQGETAILAPASLPARLHLRPG